MRTMLLVEDASFFEKAIVDRLQDIGRHQIMVARNFSEAESCLDMPICEPDLALVDLTLPDAPNGEIVDLCRNRNIPTIIFTSKFDNEVREKALAKGVIDYVLKDTPASLDYVAELLKRLSYNPKIGILILDDASVDRERVAQITSHHLYQTYQASTPAEALQMLRDHPHIRLVLADYYMPDEDGFAFLKTVRRKYSRERLSVIGMSSLSNSDNRIRFLKYGAADFIDKSYAPEEILLRISLNLDMMDRIAELNTLAMQDALTGVHNRHFLFTKAVKQIESWAHSGGKASWIAVFDLDSFKQINDEHGHDVGDSVLLGVRATASSPRRPGGHDHPARRRRVLHDLPIGNTRQPDPETGRVHEEPQHTPDPAFGNRPSVPNKRRHSEARGRRDLRRAQHRRQTPLRLQAEWV
jgi:PleD family two-component response regulator